LVAGLALNITGIKLSGVWAVLLIMISSNFYYLAPRFFPLAADWPSVAWVDVYSTLGVNYPLTVSFSILCVVWLLLRAARPPAGLIAFLVATLVLVKSHTALSLVGALGLVGIYYWLTRRDSQWLLMSVMAALGLFGLTWFILGATAQALVWEPFWFIRTMFTSPERLNFSQWELARQYLLAHPGYLGLIRLYGTGLFWFLFFNLGPLIIGLLASKRQPLIAGLSLTALGLTLAFVYSGTAIVTIQFFYPLVLALGLGTAVVLTQLPRRFSLALGIGLWLLLLPGVGYTQASYRVASTPVTVPPDRLELASFLSRQPPGIMLLHPRFRNGSWFTAYSAKPAFLGDFQTLPPLGVDFAARENLAAAVFGCTRTPLDLGVRYIVAAPGTCLDHQPGVRLLFSTSEGLVYQVL